MAKRKTRRVGKKKAARRVGKKKAARRVGKKKASRRVGARKPKRAKKKAAKRSTKTTDWKKTGPTTWHRKVRGRHYRIKRKGTKYEVTTWTELHRGHDLIGVRSSLAGAKSVRAKRGSGTMGQVRKTKRKRAKKRMPSVKEQRRILSEITAP